MVLVVRPNEMQVWFPEPGADLEIREIAAVSSSSFLSDPSSDLLEFYFHGDLLKFNF